MGSFAHTPCVAYPIEHGRGRSDALIIVGRNLGSNGFYLFYLLFHTDAICYELDILDNLAGVI